MKTTQRTFLDYLGAPHTHFIIPVYQRVYTWSDKQCATLWRDCAHAGETQSEHFIGTVLYSPDPELTSAQTQAIDIIDGQQRTATISLLIAALADYLEEQGMVLEDETDAAELRARFLLADGRNPEEASRKEKLTLSRLDRATMTAVLDHTDLPEEDDLSKNVVSNYQRFKSYLQAESDVETIWRGLKQLTVIAAEVEESDCPQTVFESLNSKGMPLTTADLARNLLFSDVEYEEQERLYDQYWKPIENLFADDDDDATSMNAALRGWLAVKAPHLRSRASDDVYDALKAFLQTENHSDTESLLRGFKGFCETFRARSQSKGARTADMHTTWGIGGRTKGLPVDRSLFGNDRASLRVAKHPQAKASQCWPPAETPACATPGLRVQPDGARLELVDQFHRKKAPQALRPPPAARRGAKAAPRERFVFGIEHLELARSTKAIFHVGRLRDAPQQ